MTFKIGQRIHTPQKFKSDMNSWHIVEKESGEQKGLLFIYVDDILVAAEEETGKAIMKRIDEQWKCSPRRQSLKMGLKSPFVESASKRLQEEFT